MYIIMWSRNYNLITFWLLLEWFLFDFDLFINGLELSCESIESQDNDPNDGDDSSSINFDLFSLGPLVLL